MPEKKSTIHLMHASMNQFEENLSAHAREDFRYIFTQVKPDIVSFTEMAKIRGELKDVAQNNGYRPIFFTPNPGEAMAINTDVLKLKNHNKKMITPRISADQNWQWINWAEVKFGDETVFYHTAHWLARLYLGGGRQQRHNTLSQQMAVHVRKHAEGNNISFFSGDWNLDDDPQGGDTRANGNQIFRSNNLLTIWDEMKVYPNTKGTDTIDIIGSYNGDGRVAAKRYKRWPKQHSDHRFVSAWYEITTKVKANPGGGPGGGGGSGGGGGGTKPDPKPVQRDPYAGGNPYDWSDYSDDTRYRFPQAVDDSEGPDHGNTISE